MGLAVGACCLARAALAAASLPEVFADGMVLQRAEKCPVWGRADEGEKVSVSFRDKTVETAARDGRWRVEVEAGEAGGPFTLAVRGTNRIEIKDVYVGEVWVVSGQSNAAVGWRWRPPKEDPEGIRFHLDARFWPKLQGKRWVAGVAEEGVQAPPLFARMFAVELRKKLKVPIGVICRAEGATDIEAWCRPAAAGESRGRKRDRYKPGELYERHVVPLQPYRIKGVVWWQGESNLTNAQDYGERFVRLIREWRKDWGQGDFPFVYVQLERMGPGAPFGFGPLADGGQLNVLWDAQRRALALPNTAMVPCFDLSSQVHPPKELISARACRAALGAAYGQKDLEWCGPLLEKAELKGDEVMLTFSHAEGLSAREVDVSKEVWTAKAPAKDGKPAALEIQSGDEAFAAAEARIDGRTVVLSAKGLRPPLRVRYAWKCLPDGNLYNSAELPASPFMTDPLK